jgi:two-component sensor histidine kinase
VPSTPRARRRWTLRTYLLIYGLVLLLPALAVGGAAVWHALSAYKVASDLRLRDTARSLAGAIDGDLGALLAVARTVAASPLLQLPDGELDEAEGWARTLQADLGVPIVVNDATPGYRQLLNTRLPPGAPLPSPSRPGEGSWDLFQRVVATRAAAVSDLFTGRVAGRPVLSVAAPVLDPAGEVRRVVVLALDPEQLSATLRVPELSGGAYAGLADSNGRIVARSRDLGRWLGVAAPGREARAALTDALEDVPLLRLPTPEGATAVVAVTRLRSAPGWTLVVAEPLASYEAPWRRPLLELGLGAAILLTLSLAAAAVLSKRMRSQLDMVVLRATSFAQGGDDPAQSTNAASGVAEFDAIGTAIRRAADTLVERERLLHLALEAAQAGAWSWAPATGEVRWSPEMFALLNLDPVVDAGVMSLEGFMGLVHPEDREALQAALEAAKREGSTSAEFRVLRRRPDGSQEERWLLCRARLHSAGGDQPAKLVGIDLDVTDRRRAEERQALLMREVDHRGKNALAVVQAALQTTPLTDAVTYREAIVSRVQALARAQSLLSETSWSGSDLRLLLRNALQPFVGELAEPRVVLSGPDLQLTASATQPLMMAFHELGTNAAKYGALSAETGSLLVTFEVSGSPGMMTVVWQERGGPPVEAPPRGEGFGMRLVESTIKRQLGGSVTGDWDRAGLTCRIAVPAARVLVQDAASAVPRHA